VETEDLASAYQDLLAAAEAIHDDGILSAEDRGTLGWTLAHIALSDRGLVGTARAVLAGREAGIDNGVAMSKTAIGKVCANTSHVERVEMVRRNARELIDLLDRTPGEAVDVTVRARLVNGEGAIVFDNDLKWGDVIRMRATEHIPGHAARVAGLAKGMLDA
jgi:hypothetical protein